MEWGRKNLSHLNEASRAKGEGHNDIFFVGMGEEDGGENKGNMLTSRRSSIDFALLASCNHTIGSRGTFTIWASRYAGGQVVTEFNLS